MLILDSVMEFLIVIVILVHEIFNVLVFCSVMIFLVGLYSYNHVFEFLHFG